MSLTTPDAVCPLPSPRVYCFIYLAIYPCQNCTEILPETFCTAECLTVIYRQCLAITGKPWHVISIFAWYVPHTSLQLYMPGVYTRGRQAVLKLRRVCTFGLLKYVSMRSDSVHYQKKSMPFSYLCCGFLLTQKCRPSLWNQYDVKHGHSREWL